MKLGFSFSGSLALIGIHSDATHAALGTIVPASVRSGRRQTSLWSHTYLLAGFQEPNVVTTTLLSITIMVRDNRQKT